VAGLVALGDGTGLPDCRVAVGAAVGGMTFGLAVGAAVGSAVGVAVAFTRSMTARATGGPAATPVTAVATTTVVPISARPMGPLRNARKMSGDMVRSGPVAMIDPPRIPA